MIMIWKLLEEKPWRMDLCALIYIIDATSLEEKATTSYKLQQQFQSEGSTKEDLGLFRFGPFSMGFASFVA